MLVVYLLCYLCFSTTCVRQSDPPYHSKYNPIERCWAALEQFWNGAILDSMDTALNWASNMSWKDITHREQLLDAILHYSTRTQAGKVRGSPLSPPLRTVHDSFSRSKT